MANTIWCAASALMAGFFAWAAAMQLNDPDPARWFALYGGAALVAAAGALAKPLLLPSRALGVIALIWAAAIAPELWGRWNVGDLGAKMSRARPEVEYGREFCGLLIVAAYCFALAQVTARRYMSDRHAHDP